MRYRDREGNFCALGLALALACCAVRSTTASAPAGAEATTTETGLDVERYDVRADVDVATKSIAGETTVTFRYPGSGPRALRFPLNGLGIDGVRYKDKEVPFDIDPDHGTLAIPLPAESSPSAAGQPPRDERVTVVYHSTPKRGLVFGDRSVYGNFFTCHWMVCSEEPGDKASFGIEVVVPASYTVVASGHLVEQHTDASGRLHSRWTEERPYSPYLYSFAAGELVETQTHAGDALLRFLGPKEHESEESLRNKFQETTTRALRFLTDRAGVPLPGGTYTQVLLPGDEAQEKSSFSLIGTEYLDPILEDPTEDWVIVHELAHQWWGNLVTCRDWSHFWLNESLATFMVAAYKEQRWGRAAYDRELRLWNEHWTVAKEAGFDVPLAYAGTYPSLRVRRAIQYSKGAVFLHRLRERMGDAPFWSGIRTFTRSHAGGTVTSADFQRAMQEAARTDLGPMFRAWVGA